MRLSLSRAWEESRRIFALDGRLLIAVALALLVLPQILAGLVAPPGETAISTLGRVVTLVAAMVGIVGQLAIVRLALGPATTVREAIRHGTRRLPALFGALLIVLGALALLTLILSALLVGAGLVEVPAPGQQPGGAFSLLVLLVVAAGLLIGVRLFMLTVPIASAEALGPFGIIRRSWRLSAGWFWPLFGLELLLLILALSLLGAAQFVGGTAAVLVGDVRPFSLAALLFAIVVAVAQAVFTALASVMLARVYAQLTGAAEASASVPTTTGT